MKLSARSRAGVPLKIAIVLLIVAAQLQPVAYSGFEAFTAEIVVPVPAVSGESRSARLIDVVVEIRYPGSGVYEVSGGGEVDDTTKYSMIMAVFMAALIAGYDPWSIDAFVRVKSLGPVAGTSGSLGVALASYYGLLHKGNGDLRSIGIAVTGAVSPDTLAVSVGEVPLKCRAANEEGLILVMPLSNEPNVQGTRCNYRAVAGIVDALNLLGLPRVEGELRVKLPEQFNEAMASVAEEIRAEARAVLSRLSGLMEPEEYARLSQRISSLIEESVTVDNVSAYAAASTAYMALIEAYTAYYAQVLGRSVPVEEAIREIEAELKSLAEKLNSMEGSGSLFYVEMLSVAYTRLADAEATLVEARRLAEAQDPQALAAIIASAKARLFSIKGWLEAAETLEGVGRPLSEDELSYVVGRFRDFTRLAVKYGEALISYLIDISGGARRGDLEAFRAGINYVMEYAERYWSEGRYVAALGFYREALARSMTAVFSGGVGGPSQEIIERYLNELKGVYTIMAARTYAAGYVSGLAEAYIQYAEVLYAREPTMNDSVVIMEGAVASLMPWLLAVQSSVAPQAYGAELGEVGEPPVAGGGGETTEDLGLALALATAAFSFAAGFYIASRAYLRSSRLWA